MNIVPASINEAGAERVVGLVNDPTRLTQTPKNLDVVAMNRWSTVWIPGVSIPEVEFLDKPFSVQVQGDIEPFSTSVTWRPNSHECIEASFTGYLCVSEISKSGGIENDYKLRKVRESFDALSEFGGFLHATVYLEELDDNLDEDDMELIFEKGLLTTDDLDIDSSISSTFRQVRSHANFLFNETAEEHYQVLKLMTEHGITPNDVVASVKIRNLVQDIPDKAPITLEPLVAGLRSPSID
jgi:hypothetical protein